MVKDIKLVQRKKPELHYHTGFLKLMMSLYGFERLRQLKLYNNKKEADVENKYNEFIVSEGYVEGTISSPNREEAHKFPKRFVEENNIEDYYDLYKRVFDSICENQGYDYGETVGVELTVATAVAYKLFMAPDAETKVEYVRDKWELRNDYNDWNRITFELSSLFRQGFVSIAEYEPFDM